jgi:hypothetical protein
MTEPIAAAQDLARELLAAMPERLAHTEGVAQKAEAAAIAFEPDEAADLVAAAWLHDIGYAPWLAGIQMHALDGGWFLQSRHFPERVCQLVAHHSGARFEARERGLLDRLEWSFPAPDAALLDALTYADMTTSPRGLPVSFDERIAEILERWSGGPRVNLDSYRLQREVHRSRAEGGWRPRVSMQKALDVIRDPRTAPLELEHLRRYGWVDDTIRDNLERKIYVPVQRDEALKPFYGAMAEVVLPLLPRDLRYHRRAFLS